MYDLLPLLEVMPQLKGRFLDELEKAFSKMHEQQPDNRVWSDTLKLAREVRDKPVLKQSHPSSGPSSTPSSQMNGP